jgi:hypothetical protein
LAQPILHFSLLEVIINGQKYKGPHPKEKFKSVVRKITETSPIGDALDPDMNCGKGSAKAAEVAKADFEAKFQISWLSGGNKHVR